MLKRTKHLRFWRARTDRSQPLGIWRLWIGVRGTNVPPVEGEHLLYSFPTSEPKEVVGPIHPKAILVITTILE